MFYLFIGVVIGTFIPTPYQAEIHRYVSSLWGRIKGLAKSTN